jgi:hypothetical protein
MAVEGEHLEQTVDKCPDAESTIQRVIVIHDDDEGSINLDHFVDQVAYDTGRVVEEIARQGGQC